MIPLLSLPAELLTSILSCLDTKDLIACNATAKHLARLISASSHLQYTISLTKHRLLSILPSHPKYPPYATRLKVLREREDAWRELAWKGRHTLQLPPTGSVYEFVGGIYGNGREDENRVTASISFLELPSSDFVPPISTTPEDGPRLERQLRTWTHAMGDVAIIDFTMDPSQNLLVLVALAPPDSKYIYNLHLRTISTNEPHPNAPAPILSCLERHPSFPPPPELFAAVRVQVSGDLVGLLIKEAPDPVGAHLEIWNWENDPYYTCSMSSQHGIDDFTFLSHSSFLIVLPVGRFEVYDFPDPLVSNHATQNQNQDQSYAQPSIPTTPVSALPTSIGSAKCTPTKKYSYDFPELSNGYMYWYISMSCNPAPGYVPLAGGRASNPFPPTLWGHGPGGGGGNEGQVEEEDATKQLYYPLPDERIHACCVYIFNPNNHVAGNGLNAGNANANTTHTHAAASAVASTGLAAPTPIPASASTTPTTAGMSTSNVNHTNPSAANTNNSNNTLTDDDLDDENQQVHSFVFFLNLKTLLQPPEEWFQPPISAQRETKTKTRNPNTNFNPKKSKSDPAADNTFAALANSLGPLWKSSSSGSGSGSGSGSSVTEAEGELVLTAPSWLSKFGDIDVDASISSSVGTNASASSSSSGMGTSLDASLHALKRRQEEKELRDAQHKGVPINGANGNGKRGLGKGKVKGSGSASPSSLSIEIPIGNGDDDDGMVDVPVFGAPPVASESSIGAGAVASSSSSSLTSTSASAYPRFPSFTSPGPHSSGKGKGKAKANGSSTPTPGSVGRENVEKKGSVSRPGVVASSSSAGPSSPFNASTFASTSAPGSGPGSTPIASSSKGRAASTPPSTSHTQSNTAKPKSKPKSKPSSTSSSSPLFFISSSSSSSSPSNTTTGSSSFTQPYPYHIPRSQQCYDVNQPIPWEMWGPSSTRWFEECLSTDWQHAIYGLRTVESVSVRERERELGRLWAEMERERMDRERELERRRELELERDREKEREVQDVDGVKKEKGKEREREDVCVDVCDGRDREKVVKGKVRKGKRKTLPDEMQEQSAEMDGDEDQDENEGCSRTNGHAGPSRPTVVLPSSVVPNGISASGQQPQIQLLSQPSGSNSTTTTLPIRRRPRRFLRVRDFNPYSIKLAEAEVAAAQTLVPTTSTNGTRVNGIHTDSILTSSLYMSKGKGKQRALPLPLSSSPSPLIQLGMSTVAHPYSYSYPIHLNVNSTLSSLLSHSLPSPLVNGYMSPPSSQISSSLSFSDSLSSSSSTDEPKANSNIWGKRRVVREPSITPVKGVFKKDIVSWLPYTEVVSEETFEVTDVMMDDCRLLLLKRGQMGKLESVEVLMM